MQLPTEGSRHPNRSRLDLNQDCCQLSVPFSVCSSLWLQSLTCKCHLCPADWNEFIHKSLPALWLICRLYWTMPLEHLMGFAYTFPSLCLSKFGLDRTTSLYKLKKWSSYALRSEFCQSTDFWHNFFKAIKHSRDWQFQTVICFRRITPRKVTKVAFRHLVYIPNLIYPWMVLCKPFMFPI